MLTPHHRFEAATDISVQWLQQQGISTLLLDLDNTLVAYKSYEAPSPALLEWISTMKTAGIGLFMLSNGSWKRASYWTYTLELEGFGMAGKPWFGFRRALRTLGVNPRQVAIVGDQLFTDVFGGNMVHIRTILVKPISVSELGYTKLVRKLERWVLSRYERV